MALLRANWARYNADPAGFLTAAADLDALRDAARQAIGRVPRHPSFVLLAQASSWLWALHDPAAAEACVAEAIRQAAEPGAARSLREVQTFVLTARPARERHRARPPESRAPAAPPRRWRQCDAALARGQDWLALEHWLHLERMAAQAAALERFRTPKAEAERAALEQQLGPYRLDPATRAKAFQAKQAEIRARVREAIRRSPKEARAALEELKPLIGCRIPGGDSTPALRALGVVGARHPSAAWFAETLGSAPLRPRKTVRRPDPRRGPRSTVRRRQLPGPVSSRPPAQAEPVAPSALAALERIGAQPGADLAAALSDALLRAILAGTLTGAWHLPWHGVTAVPANPHTGAPFRGSNRLVLIAARAQRGYASHWWASEAAWTARGYRIRAGETGTPIRAPRRQGAATAFTTLLAFNAEQIEGFDATLAPSPERPARPAAERLIARYCAAAGIRLEHDSREICYRATPRGEGVEQVIRIPPPAAFADRGGVPGMHRYTAALLHELVHSTALPLGRLQRGGGLAYAFEEMVAELGACLLGAELGLATEMRRDHLVYVQAWARQASSEPALLRRALEQANAAAEFVRALAGPPDPSEAD